MIYIIIIKKKGKEKDAFGEYPSSQESRLIH